MRQSAVSFLSDGLNAGTYLMLIDVESTSAVNKGICDRNQIGRRVEFIPLSIVPGI